MKCYVVEDIKELNDFSDAHPRGEVSDAARAEVMRLVVGGRLEEDDSYDDYDGFSHHEVKRSITHRLLPKNCIVVGDRVVGYYERSLFRIESLASDLEVPREWAKVKLFYVPAEPRTLFYGKEAKYDPLVVRVDVPEGTESIGGFGCYPNLFELHLPASLKKVEGHSAFDRAFCLDKVVFGGGAEEWCGIDFSDKNSNPCCYGAELLFGDTPVSGVEVTCERVAPYAFYGVPLRAVRFSGAVREIGAYAFSKCVMLREIDLSPCDATLGEGAFSECSGLTEVSLPKGMKAIAKDAFSHTTSLQSVTIHEGVTEIGENAFARSGLTRLALPASLRVIGKSAFSSCDGLSSVELPVGVEVVGDEAFYSCNGLTRVTARGGALTRIGEHAFAYCSGLAAFDFPEGLREIGGECFSYAAFTGEITLPASLQSLGGASFSHCEKITSFEVPASVRRIYSDLDGCPDLVTLSLPHDLEYLSLERTYRAGPLTVRYDGTRSEWKSKEIYIRVKGNAPVTVLCSDGEIRYEKSAR
ncbi:MAG: leucine-rich repeat protein [Clostridia bacterium]|nr:leucine-rich repeat protein [Clostridia bacterium]